MSQSSRTLPRWNTSWPDWFGVRGNVAVVPAEDYDKLLSSVKASLPSGMAELVLESAGLTPSGAVAQDGEKSGTAPTASAPAVLSRHSTWKRDAIEWAQETIENGHAASMGPNMAEALAQTIMAYAASSETGPSLTTTAVLDAMKDHYWDSLEPQRELVIKHIEGVMRLFERQGE